MENKSIGCTVKQCKHNNSNSDFCTLQKIQVKCHENCAETVESTDCASFKRR